MSSKYQCLKCDALGFGYDDRRGFVCGSNPCFLTRVIVAAPELDSELCPACDGENYYSPYDTSVMICDDCGHGESD